MMSIDYLLLSPVGHRHFYFKHLAMRYTGIFKKQSKNENKYNT